jgi:hypothetical protein
MAKVVLLQFATDPGAAARRELLSSLGAQVVEAEPRWPIFFDTVTAQRPSLVVISTAVIPEHGREAARYLGEGFNTRNIPVILVGVAPRDLEATAESAPQAKIVDDGELAATVKSAIVTAV